MASAPTAERSTAPSERKKATSGWRNWRRGDPEGPKENGLTTGASYRSHNVIEEGFNEPTVTALNVTYTFREESYVMMSTTPGVSFRAGALFHFVGPPSGEFKITRDLESLECRG